MSLATVSEWPHSFLSWVERWVSAATLADWILIGAGVAVLLVAWRVLNAPVRLGTIEVSAGEGEAKDEDFGRKEIATMRLELARWGLVPPGGVPAGSPTAGVAAAVEASPLEYGKFVGELIKLIPVPAADTGFKITATMFKDSDHGPHSLTYQLARADSGDTLDVDRVSADTADDAVLRASGRVFRKIVGCAKGIFPGWSQWPDLESMLSYRTALQLEREGKWTEAADCFEQTREAAPDNMLARLRLANCLERRAGSATEPTLAAALRVEALEVYRRVTLREPNIFEARYRASVLLSVLADTLADVDPAARRTLRELTKPPRKVDLETRMRALSKAEATASRWLLQPLATLVLEGRMRHRLEPRGTERRRLRRALRISRLCLLARRHWSHGQPIRWGGAELRRLWWRFVLRWHFVLRDAGWQAHYNAACFYALLPEVDPDLEFATQASQSRRVLQKRMIHHLKAALRDPERQVKCEYVRVGDPDFDVVRRLKEWQETMDVFCEREPPPRRRLRRLSGRRLRRRPR
jgi:hypothetical protein